ncbi:MAG TPA: long-chain fatty acid--CoA ligase [Desulfobulbus sp.]|nr:long-chain fatty acid--CoA ligase [Desulfobulbus sp.]
MVIEFLRQVFADRAERSAVIWQDREFSYGHLLSRLDHWRRRLEEEVAPGTVTVLEADFSPEAIALLLALIERGTIVVPLTPAVQTRKKEFIETAAGELDFLVDAEDKVHPSRLPFRADHPLYDELRRRGHPGLVLFSSGTTGRSKAILHDVSHLLRKYTTRRHDFTTLAFLLFDHIAGIDTLLYVLSNGSCLVTVPDRSPDTVCRAVERYRVEVLPVSATFLHLLLLSGAHERYDLGSLKYIAYGSEVMPEATLKRCAELFPGVTLLQKYGTTEVGTLRSRSESSDSPWVRIGGEGFQTRVVDGILQIKAHSAMLGYLNAPSPFTRDGWFITGDRVEVRGEYMRIHGRDSDIINVGGEKVFPTEVEDLILQLDNVADVTVYGEPNLITGNIVCADVSLVRPEEEPRFIARVKRFCREHLQPYKVPVKVNIVDEHRFSQRFKKLRQKRD